jgi:hypothetical protein
MCVRLDLGLGLRLCGGGALVFFLEETGARGVRVCACVRAWG